MSDESNRALREAFEREVDLTEELQAKVEDLTADRDEIRRKYIAEAKETDRLQAKIEELEADVRGLKAQIFECEHNECFTGHVGDFLYLYPEDHKP